MVEAKHAEDFEQIVEWDSIPCLKGFGTCQISPAFKWLTSRRKMF
jgi:hypothetical protein